LKRECRERPVVTWLDLKELGGETSLLVVVRTMRGSDTAVRWLADGSRRPCADLGWIEGVDTVGTTS
jgi:hypothetical protein